MIKTVESKTRGKSKWGLKEQKQRKIVQKM